MKNKSQKLKILQEQGIDLRPRGPISIGSPTPREQDILRRYREFTKPRGAMVSIARTLGISRQRVQQVLVKFDIRTNEVPEDKCQEIEKLYRSASTMAEISKSVGLSIPLVSRILKSRSVPIRTPVQWYRLRPWTSRRLSLPEQEFSRMYQSGISVERISHRFNLDPRTVRSRLRGLGVAVAAQHSVRPTRTKPCPVQAIKRLKRSGLSCGEISRKLGISRGTVFHHCEDLGA